MTLRKNIQMNAWHPARLIVLVLVSVSLSLQSAADDWRMWGGSGRRNNVVNDANVCLDWDVGKFDRKTRTWSEQKNVKWTAQLGSQTYGTPIVSGGRVFIGTNNQAGYLKRYPQTVDLGCLLCFRESDGKFLWQHSNEKLLTGRVHDWPMQGICSTPLVEEDRLWYVSNRGEVVCLDAKGFYDKEDDGPLVAEWAKLFETDVTLQASLDRGRISDQWRTIFSKSGQKLTGRVGVVKDWAKDGWVIFKWERVAGKQTRVPLFRIQVDGEKLRANKIDGDDIDRPTMQLFSVRNHQVPSLRDAVVGAELRQLFEQSGISLPKSTRLNVDEPEKSWYFAWQDGDHRRTIRLENTDGRLRALVRLEPQDRDEADVVWRYDMMKELGVSQHNMASCSPVAWGNTLFICTSNGVDETHLKPPAFHAPSFIALDKITGKLLWKDASPGGNILHGQWSSPAVDVLGGVPQVIFPGGDGWIYSFRADRWNEKEQKPILLWKFDANPKESKWILGGRGTRNNVIAMPVIYDGLVYIVVGQDPEHGEGVGNLWCIDPKRRGDVSSELAMRIVRGMRQPIPHRRLQAVDEAKGEIAVANPNSAVVWHYDQGKPTGDADADFFNTVHRTLGSPVIKNDLLFVGDFTGVVHCFNAKTGKANWNCDLLAQCWASPVIVNDSVLIGDEDGDVAFLRLSADPSKSIDDEGYPLRETNVFASTYSTPVVANKVLYIATRSHLLAIAAPVDRDAE